MQRSSEANPTARWMISSNSNERAVTQCDNPASASASNPSTSSLMKDGEPCLPDQFVERRNVGPEATATTLDLPSFGAAAGFDESPRQRGSRGIVEVDHHRCRARHPSNRGWHQGDGVVASEQDRQRSKQGRLRLRGDDMGPKPPKRPNSVADVCADVEDKVARLDEPCAERIHRVGASRMPVIGAQRSKDTARGSKASQHGLAWRDRLGGPQSRKLEMLQCRRRIRFLGKATDADARESQS